MYPLDLEQFRRRTNGESKPWESNRVPRHKPGGRFLKGPVPVEWLGRAGSLPGKALHVGLAVWFAAGLAKRREVVLTARVLAAFGVKRRRTAYEALERLKAAGLVAVERHRGRAPRVTILDTGEAVNG
jgi:hypothetical protein